ncbi:hypothetical protein K7X08_032046 [Anisodus acutangulus]|uniref:RING-CH-type domain-containing protein n=1 Tax=Anisodus acutangulus TaxID=402998 RepID=A0A9Q1MR76_9SOLA|nr:hypothetical protein K7X08_032046 [Anisodus acutangulus]
MGRARAGLIDQIQCRICLESDGWNFIAPCKCKGASKYVHRECLDQWHAVKEGFAFSHYVLFIFLAVHLVIASLGYLVYVINKHHMFWLHLHWGFGSELSFYYICGALLFFALMGISGCFLTCFDEKCVQTVIRLDQVELISASILTYAPGIVQIRHVSVARTVNVGTLALTVNVGIA